MKMKLSISNIAWTKEHDEQMYSYLRLQGFEGLEIAPTRLFSDNPYEHLAEAQTFALKLRRQYGLSISSMQSIWYGRTESIFGSSKDRNILVKYTKQAIDFAAAIDCSNLVFGCPKNRNVPDRCQNYKQIATEFFMEIADYAEQNGAVIALEPNPPIYNTNFMNGTLDTLAFVRSVGMAGLKVNVDFGTIIYNGEDVADVADNIGLVNHIHISEPNLLPLERREIHAQLLNFKYDRYISIEMKTQKQIETVKKAIKYVCELLM